MLDGETIRGMVVKIQGSSFVDGPGIRTTVFLKGCPLRCLWCCNPETQEAYAEKNQLFPVKGYCEIFGKWMTVDEIIDIVSKDISFYRNSGGGVTVAGGEPTFQSEFCLEIIRRCRLLRIHTALDTCGCTIDKKSFQALKEADLLLYDLKNMNPIEHHKNSGIRNDIILDNLKRLVGIKKKIVIRIPLIPGYTDSEKNITSIGQFLYSLGKGSIQLIELLPYHKGGAIIYEMLGRSFPLEVKLQRQSDEYLQKLQNILAVLLKGRSPISIGHSQ